MLFCKNCVSAAIADQSLVVRVEGDNPRLWRAALADVAGATLEVREIREGATVFHGLMFVRAGAGSEEIARFTTRRAAQKAFRTVSDRLMQAADRKRPWIIRMATGFGKAIIWILFLFMLALVAAQFLISPRAVAPGAERPAAASTGPVGTPTPPAGVPVPADQLFGE